MMKIQLCITGIIYVLQYNKVNISLHYCFYCIYDHINAALVSVKVLFKKYRKKILPIPKFWKVVSVVFWFRLNVQWIPYVLQTYLCTKSNDVLILQCNDYRYSDSCKKYARKKTSWISRIAQYCPENTKYHSVLFMLEEYFTKDQSFSSKFAAKSSVPFIWAHPIQNTVCSHPECQPLNNWTAAN